MTSGAEAYIGLMSGTSMDGIDAVLVRLDPAPRILQTHQHPWPESLRAQLRRAAAGEPMSTAGLARLDSLAGEVFAEAAAVLAGAYPGRIRAIGSHGQTLAHAPGDRPGHSLQIGNPAIIAERTGITTVADFRRRDIAAGGQGAPLVPAFHAATLRHPGENRVILNIGGIANISVLPADPAAPVTGFDTGPGNCLMDAWMLASHGEAYDSDGRFAAAGRIHPELLQTLLSDPYFAAPAPKSTGTDYFSPAWLQERLAAHPGVAPEDVQATLLALSARSIAEAIRRLSLRTQRVLVCGGGVHNPELMTALSEALDCPVESTATAGMDPDWVEAAAFAWLARQTLLGRPGNLPDVTGARGPRVLGAIHPSDGGI